MRRITVQDYKNDNSSVIKSITLQDNCVDVYDEMQSDGPNPKNSVSSKKLKRATTELT